MKKTERMAPAVATRTDGELCHLAAGFAFHETYLRDQTDLNHSVTDLHLVCEDGHIPVHRYVLMGSSQFLMELLIDQDPSELAVIHLLDVKLVHLIQIMSLVYTGKSVISTGDQIPIFSVMKSLGISTRNFEFRKSKPTDARTSKLRYYIKEEDDTADELECTFIDSSLINGVNKPTSKGSSSDLPKTVGPRVLSRRHIDKAETKKFMSLKVELPSETIAVGSKDLAEDFRCIMCQSSFDTEECLAHHLSTKCSSNLRSKFEYSEKQCLVCKRKFTSYNIWGLLTHVESCTKLLAGRKRLHPSSKEMETANDVPNITKDEESAVVICDPPPKLHKPAGDKKQEISGELRGIETKKKRCYLTYEIDEMAIKAVQSKILAEGIDDLELQMDEGTEEVVKTKKKRRRRRIAAYNISKRRKPKKKVDSPDSSLIQDPGKSLDNLSTVIDDGEECDRVSDEELGLDETLDDDDKNVVDTSNKTRQFIQENDMIDPDVLRLKLGITSVSQIGNLSDSSLKTVFRMCPLCENEYPRIKDVSKCLRYHGYRYCWVCLKILPYKGFVFDAHSVTEHCVRNNRGDSSDKVKCPLCPRDFEYKLALPTHLGNFHCPRLTSPGVENNDEDYVEVSSKVETVYSENVENRNDDDAPMSPPATISPLLSEDDEEGNLLDLFSDDEDSEHLNSHLSSENDPSKLREILSGPSFSMSSSTSKDYPGRKRVISKAKDQERFRISIGLRSNSPDTYKPIVGASSTASPNDNQNLDSSPSSECQSKEDDGSPDHNSRNQSTINEKSETLSKAPKVTEQSGITGRKFLRQTVIDGVAYNIYCLIGDDNSKKVIAIPAGASQVKDK